MNGVLARFTKKNSREITTAVALVLVILIFSLLNSRYMEYDNLIDIIPCTDCSAEKKSE